MINERTLKRWRKDALKEIYRDKKDLGPGMIVELSERILRMTQELLDLHLIRK